MSRYRQLKRIILRQHIAKTDFIIINISGVILCLLLIPLFSDRAYQFLFGENNNSNRESIAKVIEIKNSNRLKRADSFSWDYITGKTDISKGDSLYTGAESYSRVEMKDGGILDIGPFSLVKFTDVNQLGVPNLYKGQFDLEVQGNMKIVMNGKVIDFAATKSKVRVQIKENKKIEIKVISGGEIQIKNQNGNSLQISKSRELPKESLESFFKEEPKQQITQTENVQKEIPKAQAVSASVIDKSFVHFWTKDDFYQKVENGMSRLSEPKSLISSPLGFQTNQFNPNQTIYFKLSQSADFATSAIFKLKTDSNSLFSIPQYFLGKNFFQTSLDGKNWSESSEFLVKKGELKKLPPQLRIETRPVVASQDYQKWIIQIKPETNQENEKFLLEVSYNSEFLPDQTKVIQTGNEGFTFQTDKPLEIYIRARVLAENDWISDYSKSEQLKLDSAQFIVPTILAEVPKSLFKQKRTIASKPILSPKKLSPQQSKPLNAEQTLAVNNDRKSLTMNTEPTDSELFQSQPNMESTTLVRPIPSADDVFNNSRFNLSKLSFSFGNFNLLSIDQIDQGKNPPSVLTASVSLNHWMNSHGLDFNLQSKVSTIQQGVDQPQSPFKAELKYAYRWILDHNLFSPVKKFQLSWILGSEYYRNPGQDYFSKQYELIKSGLGVHFPAFRRWDTGGELLYGVGTDQSKKYEISGFLGYYLSMNKTIGMGYRVYLFQAGSPLTSSSFGFPYSEGSVEGSTYFRWSY